MKTKMKNVMLAIMIVLFSGMNAMAFEDSLKVNDEKSFDLLLTDISHSTQITLKDKRNNILFNHTINKGGSFAKTFNLELLPKGEYTVEIENETKIKSMTLVVNDESVFTGDAMTYLIYKPVLTEKGTVVYLTQFSPQSKPLYVAIYNNRNELIYEETLSGKLDLGKKFDFSKTYDGEYRFYLESNGMTYDHLVYVEK